MKKQDMELRHIQTFLAVAEELHFGRAADRLHIAQPAVSQQIRSLEKDLGVELFDRSSRNVSLTSQGAALIEPAHRILDANRLARRAVRADAADVLGTVTLNYGGAANSSSMPTLARAVRKELPGVDLQLLNNRYAGRAALAVARGDLDIAFSRLPTTTTNVSHRPYALETPVVLLSAEHPLAEAETISMKDLSGEDFVTYPGNAGSSVRNMLVTLANNAGFTPHITQDAPDALSIFGLVSAGVGVTVHLDSSAYLQMPGIVVKQLTPTPPPTVATICWRDEFLTPASRAVLELSERVLPTVDTQPAADN
ncbi:LysR substrate-binding domain-containing protein [Corynebacterium sp. S7]